MLAGIQVWVALDAVDEQNGALVVLPRSHATPAVERAVEAAQAEHLGVLLCVPAGTAVRHFFVTPFVTAHV